MNDKILTIKKSTLVDIANEVRAKTGSTELIKVADLDDAVANLQGGGGGGVIETNALPSPYAGDPVPNSGYVEKVYFNTSLSIEEVVTELNKLTPISSESPEAMMVIGNPLLRVYDSANNKYTLITVFGGTMQDANTGEKNTVYWIWDSKKAMEILQSGGTDEDVLPYVYWIDPNYNNTELGPAAFVGWNPNFNGEIEIDYTVSSLVDEYSSSLGTFTVGTENDKIANLFYLNKQPNPEFNAEAIYKLPDGTMWMHEDGWRQLKKTKKLTIKNVAGCEFSVPFYIDAENMFDADGNANESEEVMLTFAVNETKTFYVGSSVVLKGDWYCGNPDTRANVVTSGFTIEDIGRYDVITVTGDNASVNIQREEL